MTTHFIIDIETMGVKSAASAITSIACVPIDFNNLQDFDYYNKFSYCSIPTDSCNAFGIFTDLLTQRILYSLLYMFQKNLLQ